MILATVKGDVHDIGKNLMEIILANNGYPVVNLGMQGDARGPDRGRPRSTSRTRSASPGCW